MEYAYQKLMTKHKLEYSELPEDAQTGIDIIKDVNKAIVMAEKKGNTVSQKTYNKLKINDKFVVGEILDYINDKENDDDDAPPFNADEIKEDMLENNDVKLDPLGLSVDEELKAILEQGKTKLSTEELKEDAPKSYNIIFDSYNPEEENGIETSLYSILEKEDEMFYISKK